MTPAQTVHVGIQDGVSIPITPEEFAWFTTFLRGRTGIELKDGKQALVMSRLDRRLRHHSAASYKEYFALISGGRGEEARIALDLMTTNETYFFREPQHFEMLPRLLPSVAGQRPLRVWSAASSSGEEAYSIALTLAEHDPSGLWEVFGSDLSHRIVDTAARGLYPIEAAQRVPGHLRTAYCLRGRGEHEGFFTFDAGLRSRVTFRQLNLTRPLPDLGTFDVVFLRNILIYFSSDTKRQVVDRVATTLRPGGYLLTSHAETLMGLETTLESFAPSVYRRREQV
ncbi:CheR family methyltransferase [Lapillicoccus jejuensis]|uniref:protein-glutamate O-methyltransferase n=1 Tax=Lapillicoccus jejuensis TaxID=402171 RepID=A0A542E4K0_9MICO|nr:protein-glutamate O-methyltransferase CheR [Lapillicoccus jejuensis]TQJ10247.1 chemotaxis protein methyltransferase CheR [Lapillicoccus jejuensis]